MAKLGNIELADRSQRPWWRDAVVYQIYARSFADGNSDGIGDFAGISRNVDYLAKLGIDAVWITPCYATPWKDGGYDVANYYEISPEVGNKSEVSKLADLLHQRGMKLILDLVPNHTSDQHEWFQAALAAGPNSSQWARYHIIKGKDDGKNPPNDWRSVFGGAAWSPFPNHPGYWYLHLFDSTQPDLNWENEEVKAEFEQILRYWFDLGVDGFRIDVAHGMVKDPGYPDNDVYTQMVGGVQSDTPAEYPQWDRPAVHEIYRAWRKIADEYSPAKVFCAEAWVNDPNRMAQYIRKDELHTAFNFTYFGAGWDAVKQRNAINESISTAAIYGAPTTWVLSNHDVVRHRTRLAPDLGSRTNSGKRDRAIDEVAGEKIARAATLFMLGLPGSSYLYQGEELGLPEVTNIPADRREDPAFFRTSGEDGYRDGCRVPLPWTTDAATNYGFSQTAGNRAWLPQPDSWGQLSVAVQETAAGSSLNFYRSALKLRKSLPQLGDGALVWADQDSTQYLAFTRGEIFIVVNPSGTDLTIALPSAAELLIASDAGVSVSGNELKLPADTAGWLRLTA